MFVALFLEDFYDFAHENVMVVIAVIVCFDRFINNRILVHLLDIELFADDNSFCFVKEWSVFSKVWGEVTFFGFINISATIFSAVRKSASVFFTEKCTGKILAVVHKLKCETLRANKSKNNVFVPKHSESTPGSGHCVVFVFITCCKEHPVLTYHFKGYYYKKLAFVAVLSLLVIGYGIFDAIRVKSGAKQKSLDYVRNAKLMGVSDMRILFVHIMPNVLPVLLSTVMIGFNNAVLSEASLSYLGVGVQPPDPSLGRMLSEAQSYLLSAPWYALSVGLAIILLVLGFGMLSEGLGGNGNA